MMSKNIDRSREVRLWTKMIMRALRVFILTLVFIPSWREYLLAKLEYWKLKTQEKINEMKAKRGE